MNIFLKIKALLNKIPVINKIYLCLAWYKGRLVCYRSVCKEIKNYKKTQPNPVFLLFTPEHQNLGDHAIAYAEKKMLDELNIPFYEVTHKLLHNLHYYKLMSVFNGAMLLITGGGNLGSLWTWIENINREIIKNNPDSMIIILPNTIYYGNTEEELRYLEESKRIYNSHKNLYIYAREKTSYDFMKGIYNNVKLIPDMVLRLRFSSSATRNGCILCLRSDCEAVLSEEKKNDIKSTVSSLFNGNVFYSDTVIDYSVPLKERRNELIKKLYAFTSSQLVITDRLHGMIFAAITGTNCIVLNSKSPKLRGCYEWIKHLDYIRFADDVSEIESVYRTMPETNNKYDNTDLMKHFDELKADILNHYNSFYSK